MTVYVYSASGDMQEIKVFSTFEKAVAYTESVYDYTEVKFVQHRFDDNCWIFDDPEDPVEILKLEVDNHQTI